MKYEKRLICFFDLLGFSAAIKQAEREPDIAKALFDIFSEFKNGGLETAVYGAIPFLDENGIKTCDEHYGAELMNELDPSYRMVATQFSDSFVVSAPVDNPAACDLLLHAIQIVHLQFFFRIGMLMRGGITVGNVVHERGGALFGPAMIEAYELESKHAVYSRVVVSEKASEFIHENLGHSLLAPAFFRGFDGFKVFDLISALLHSSLFRSKKSVVEQQLMAVEKDILENAAAAHPKIAYLLDRWQQDKHRFADVESTKAAADVAH